MRWRSSSRARCRSGRRSCSSATACSSRSTRASPARFRTTSPAASTAARYAHAASWSMPEDRFARTAQRVADRQDEHAAELAAKVVAFVQPRGDERALDVGTGAGALALALAPHVGEVVGVDVEPELLARARERAPANATFEEADATQLPFPDAAFDLAGSQKTLHHVRRPE